MSTSYGAEREIPQRRNREAGKMKTDFGKNFGKHSASSAGKNHQPDSGVKDLKNEQTCRDELSSTSLQVS